MIILLNMSPVTTSSRSMQRSLRHGGFTLIEMLVVMFIVMLLAAVALPTVRETLQNQKNTRAARSIVSFIDVARSRAIAEGREVGVLVERLSDDVVDTVGTSAGIRIRQLTGVPPYSGESGDARASLEHETDTISRYNASGGSTSINWSTIPGVNQAIFDSSDNQLLAVSAILYNDANPAVRIKSPIRPYFDRIELPGGKIVTILQIDFDPLDSTKVRVRFDLREPTESSTTRIYPRGHRRELAPLQAVKYRIHRSPIRSNTAPLTLPRGIAIDFNYSGVGITGAQFSNAAGTNNIAVIFGPDGRVSRYIDASGTQHMPAGQLFFCLGDFAGIRPDDIYADSGRDRANINRDKSSWIVINNQTGRTFTAPMTSVTSGTLTAAASTAKLAQTLKEARLLASLSDKVEGF